jgi:hypothetical protein
MIPPVPETGSMSERSPEHRHLPTREESRGLRAELDELARRGAELAQVIEAVLESETHDGDGIARLAACRSTIADQRLARLVGWMVLLDGRLSSMELRLDGVSREVSGHEEALKLVCEVLKDLDDPYGFGLSLDERVAPGSSECIPSEPEG